MSTVTTNTVQVGKIGDLKPGEMKTVSVQDHEFLLARAGESYYAADNRCPHMGGNLSKGKLAGTVVTCPRHHAQFDLKDGQVVRWTNWPAALVAVDQVRSHKRPLTVYSVTIEGEKILVRI
jgi:3-phenylpropionate/trans-cinnamate dioxygenase ferredoxin component